MEHKSLISKSGIFIDIILSIIFFCFMTKILATHAPAETEKMRLIVGAYTSSCLTGVFWLTIQLFRVTLVDQLRRKKTNTH